MFCESSAVIQKHSPSVRFCFFHLCCRLLFAVVVVAACLRRYAISIDVCCSLFTASVCVCVCVFETKAKVVYHVIHTIQTMGICYANMLCRYAKLNGIESNWMSDM